MPDYGPLNTGFDDDGKVIFIPEPSGPLHMLMMAARVCPCCGQAFDEVVPTRKPPSRTLQ